MAEAVASAAVHRAVCDVSPSMNDHILQYPAFVVWDVTGNCNQKCFYCYNYWRTETAAFSVRDERSYAEIAESIVSRKPATVILSGGEPLLVFAQIREQIDYFRQSGIYVRILTNGSLITEEIAAFCRQAQIHLMISFPSVDPKLFERITNCGSNYDAVIHGMDLLKAHGVSFSPNIVVTKLNLEDFPQTAQFLIDRYRPQKLFISRVTRPANASKAYDQFALEKADLVRMFRDSERLSRQTGIEISGCGGFPYCIFPSEKSLMMFGKRCGAGKNGYCVDMAGNVRACSRDSDQLGNLFTDDFMTLRKSLTDWGERTEIPENCRACRIADVCRGGCRMTNLDTLRSGKAVDCDADPEKAPRRLPSRVIWILPWKRFRVLAPLHSVEYAGICRVSHQHHLVYLDKKHAEYLLNKSTISVLRVMLELRVAFPSAKRVVLQLFNAGLISK